jgi:AcrR family transcriptional regulator
MSSSARAIAANRPKPASGRRAARLPASAPYHHGNLRETLLVAADAVLTDRGVQGITLRDVARAAGVSHAAPYHHFSSLDELLAAVAERAFILLAGAIELAVGGSDPANALVAITDAYVRFARAHPAQFRLMFGPLLTRKNEFPAFKVAAERAFGLVLAAAQAQDSRNAPMLALCGWSMAHGLSNLLIDGALDKLPIRIGRHDDLARTLAQQMLGLRS